MRPEIHDVDVEKGLDIVMTCPKCPYKAVIVGQTREILVPGDPTVAHVGVW